MNKDQIRFLEYLDQWKDQLPITFLSDLTKSPERCAIISVDIINGFCTQGPLSSPRVQAIVDPIVSLLEKAWNLGVKNIILTQDTHEPDAVEFGSFPPHCIRGTSEAESVPELKALPFYQEITIIEKNSIHSGLHTGLSGWMSARPNVDTFIVVGDCTDLCVYQLAMFLRLDANARQITRRVIVPEECVQTYDMPVLTAAMVGAMPHQGDLTHLIFLNHMALNGIEVVKSIQ